MGAITVTEGELADMDKILRFLVTNRGFYDCENLHQDLFPEKSESEAPQKSRINDPA